MTVFIAGGAKCGKSAIAQDLAVKLAGGGRLYYVATMIPTGAEDDARIRRHLLDRRARALRPWNASGTLAKYRTGTQHFWWTTSHP